MQRGGWASLYIPIWFYSNNDYFLRAAYVYCLYIPIWFYSNPFGTVYVPIGGTFTFQSGSIQIIWKK